MLTIDEIKKKNDRAYESGYDTRLKMVNDNLFCYVTQWDEDYLSESDLGIRLEFNKLRKAVRKIITDLMLNPAQADFEPEGEAEEGASELMDGMYRAEIRNNVAREAKDNASQESIVCGFGAWVWENEYKNQDPDDNDQVLKRRPIYEAAASVFWDPNARLRDKSDAKFVSVLTPYTEEGIKELKEELGSEDEVTSSSFSSPEITYAFPWLSETKRVWVTKFYHRKKEKVKYFHYVNDETGERKTLTDEQVKSIGDSLKEDGYTEDGTKTVHRYVVRRYIATGEKILDVSVVPGENIPVVPVYGERAYIEGEEHIEGIVRLAKDPSRFRNFQISYLADIVSLSPREKPIFLQEQIQGFEDMYDVSGADNNLPYLLQRKKSPNADAAQPDLPLGPVGYVKAPEVPTALIAAIQATSEAIEDVAGVGLPQDITNTNLSGTALRDLGKRVDMQTYVYQAGLESAVRRDAEVFASMLKDTLDTEREVTLVSFDGSSRKDTVNKSKLDFKTMEHVTVNDIPKMSFNVYAKIGPAFESVREQAKEQLKELLNGMQQGTPEYNMVLMEYLSMLEGSGFEDIRNYARKQLILSGVKDPETEEEKKMVEESKASQNDQQDPALLEGQARIMEGQAALKNEENDAANIKINAFKAETQRLQFLSDAKASGVKVESLKAQTTGTRIDNTLKLRAAVN